MPLVKPPQNYVAVDAALPQRSTSARPNAPGMVKQSIDICEKKGVVGAGYIPKLHWTDARATPRACSPTTATPRRA